MAYQTPGVYIEELSAFPPSVVAVSTAIPAFVGYTQTGPANEAIRVGSFLEFQDLFGKPPNTKFTVSITTTDDGRTISVNPPDEPKFFLHYAINHYFRNGGGPCYIVSVAQGYTGNPNADDLSAGIEVLNAIDEPTLLVIPEAVGVDSDTIAGLYQAALDQCAHKMDRFALMDVPGATAGKSAAEVRTLVGTFREMVGEHPDYGAAYFPYLETDMSLAYEEPGVTVHGISGAPKYHWEQKGCINVDYQGSVKSPKVKIAVLKSEPKQTFAVQQRGDEIILKISVKSDDVPDGNTLAGKWGNWIKKSESAGFTVEADDPGDKPVEATKGDTSLLDDMASNVETVLGASSQEIKDGDVVKVTADVYFEYSGGKSTSSNQAAWTSSGQQKTFEPGTLLVDDNGRYFVVTNDSAQPIVRPAIALPTSLTKQGSPPTTMSLDELAKVDTAAYNAVLSELRKQRITLPPSAAMAGVYAATDASRGVWKAPANVALAATLGPAIKITDDDQKELNVHSTGKSINAIRSFAGEGTLVWGARTLAGNDNNWRYISVRRLFIMMEESIRESTKFAVFEPNVQTTWLKVKSMVDSFLYTLWQDGGLAGSTPEEAYFVDVGLGRTMNDDNILNGEMIVKVGAAPARPAEFVIIQVTQKLQES